MAADENGDWMITKEERNEFAHKILRFLVWTDWFDEEYDLDCNWNVTNYDASVAMICANNL